MIWHCLVQPFPRTQYYISANEKGYLGTVGRHAVTIRARSHRLLLFFNGLVQEMLLLMPGIFSQPLLYLVLHSALWDIWLRVSSFNRKWEKITMHQKCVFVWHVIIVRGVIWGGENGMPITEKQYPIAIFSCASHSRSLRQANR